MRSNRQRSKKVDCQIEQCRIERDQKIEKKDKQKKVDQKEAKPV